MGMCGDGSCNTRPYTCKRWLVENTTTSSTVTMFGLSALIDHLKNRYGVHTPGDCKCIHAFNSSNTWSGTAFPLKFSENFKTLKCTEIFPY